jgi:hypothetical protein
MLQYVTLRKNLSFGEELASFSSIMKMEAGDFFEMLEASSKLTVN